MEIATVVMGFLQICSGVVLLQLSKSAKDVPDAAVFKGDLDQVREVATQEEPESEPRADSIRGTAAIIRRISTVRRNMEDEEARRFFEGRREDNLTPPAGNEIIEWDGLRRRKTVIGEGPAMSKNHTPGSAKGAFPPLGMSHFPAEDGHAAANEDGHSFLGGIRSHASSVLHPAHWRAVHGSNEQTDSHLNPGAMGRIHGSGGTDTSYHGAEVKADQTTFQRQQGDERSDTPPRSVSWADEVHPGQIPSRESSTGSEPPPHVARRQFSFNTVINRILPRGDSPARSLVSPTRGILRRSAHKDHRPSTEEERLGLVHGDSQDLNDEDMSEKLERTWSSSSGSSEDNGRRLIEALPHERSHQLSTPMSTTAFPSYEEHDGYHDTYADTHYMDPPQQNWFPTQTDGAGGSWQLPPARSVTGHATRSRLPSASLPLRSNPLPPLPDEDLVVSARTEPYAHVELRSPGHSRGGSRSGLGRTSLPSGRPGGRRTGWRRNESGSSSEAGPRTASGQSGPDAFI